MRHEAKSQAFRASNEDPWASSDPWGGRSNGSLSDTSPAHNPKSKCSGLARDMLLAACRFARVLLSQSLLNLAQGSC